MVERDLFLKALEIPNPSDRAAFLDRECVGNAQLRQGIDALLSAAAAAGNFLDQPHPAAGQGEAGPTGAFERSRADRAEQHVGSIIAGKYKLLQQIGEGGMGSVFMADQTEPVKRRVAVKLIRGGMDSKSVLARFEAERQALALMDHPNIAKVLDAGTTGESSRAIGEPSRVSDRVPAGDDTRRLTPLGSPGQPFFVMELVKGVPINEFCDTHKLSIGERLNLFMQVCSAVQHAHQKGIIHRDLKPSNILVESHDGKPVPKVIDFGLAKAMSGQPLTEHTLFTGFGTVAGTPLYMAPEQAKFNAIDIDTRADIYALGVILYELLTGSTPIERDTFKKAALDEILRVVREQEPPTPSKRLSSTNSKPSVAANRQTEPAKLGRFVRGELDWIVMKALSKERDRRYETANGFAKDIERFLNHEPVVAGPPSARYKLRKFVRRNRPQVIAASLVLLTLVGGVVGTTVGLFEAKRQERAALKAADEERQAKEREAAQRAIAVEQRTKAEKARDRTRDVLDAMTSSATGDSLSTQKEISADQKKFLTEVLTYYREFAGEKADDEQTRARTAKAAYRVGHIESRLGRKEQGRAAFQMARDGYRTLAADFPTVPDYRLNLAGNHLNLGNLLADLGKRAEAQEQYRQALAIQEKLAADFPAVPAYRLDLARSHNNLGILLVGLGKRAEAEEQFRNALAIQEKLAADFPTVPAYQIDLGTGYFNYGIFVGAGGRAGESLGWFDKAIATLAPVHRAEPRDVTAKQLLRNSHMSRARAYDALTNHAEAVKDWDRAIELSPAAEQLRYRAIRANSRLQAGMVAEAVAEVAELMKSSNWNAGQWYDFACVYAVASGKIADKKQEYADRAMELLQKAVKAGFKNAAHMAKDTDLDPLRVRADFKKLLAELAKKSMQP